MVERAGTLAAADSHRRGKRAYWFAYAFLVGFPFLVATLIGFN